MDFPKEITRRTRKEWLELAQSSDPAERKKVTEALRLMGVQTTDYLPLNAEQRVDRIMEAQGEDEAPKEEKKAAAKTSKGAAASTTTSEPASAGGKGGAGLDEASRKALQGLAEKADENNQLLRKIHDLLVVQILSNPQVKGNAEEMDVTVELLGNA